MILVYSAVPANFCKTKVLDPSDPSGLFFDFAGITSGFVTFVCSFRFVMYHIKWPLIRCILVIKSNSILLQDNLVSFHVLLLFFFTFGFVTLSTAFPSP